MVSVPVLSVVLGEIIVVGNSELGMGASSVSEELGKSPLVLVGIGSFLALLVAGRMAVPAIVSVSLLVVVLGEIVEEWSGRP